MKVIRIAALNHVKARGNELNKELIMDYLANSKPKPHYPVLRNLQRIHLL